MVTGTSVIVGLVAILIAEGLKRCRIIQAARLHDLGAALCVGSAVILSLVGGAILPRIFTELPRDLASWQQIGAQDLAELALAPLSSATSMGVSEP